MTLLKYLIKSIKKMLNNERGSWGLIGAVTISTVGGALMSGGKGGKSGGSTVVPDYKETTEARQLWWENVQGQNAENGYGAITPNWDEIWQQALDKVNAYYNGTATNPTGAFAKLKAVTAQKNMSDSPALERSIARLSAEQGGQVKDLAVTQATNKAQYEETGRQNWLSQLSSLSSLRPATMGSPTSSGYTPLLSDATTQMLGNGLNSLWGRNSGVDTGTAVNNYRATGNYTKPFVTPWTAPNFNAIYPY